MREDWTVLISQKNGTVEFRFNMMTEALSFIEIAIETSDPGVQATIIKNEPAEV